MQVVGSRGKKALALQQGLGCGSRMVLTHTVSGKDAGAPTPTPPPSTAPRLEEWGAFRSWDPWSRWGGTVLWDEAVLGARG